MNIFTYAFNTILYQPLLNALVLLYQYLPGKDFGIAVVVLTILIKFLVYPLGSKAIKSQKILNELQPKIKEIQEKYKNDKEKQVAATLELYKKEKINPFTGCLPLLVQLPILFALYQVFWRGGDPAQMSYLYSFVPKPESINPAFLGIINLSKPNIYLAFLAGITQFILSKISTPKKQKTKVDKTLQLGDMMQRQMLYFLPIFTVLILWNLPSAIGLYWVATTIFSIVQQYYVLRKYSVG